jgi:predicted PurR-regulated permease PerM
MDAKLIFAAMVLSVLIVLFIISKLNRAIKLLNNRVNIHSSLLKKLKDEQPDETEEQDEVIRRIIEKDFKMEWKAETAE